MIAWSIEAAHQSNCFDRVIVSIMMKKLLVLLPTVALKCPFLGLHVCLMIRQALKRLFYTLWSGFSSRVRPAMPFAACMQQRHLFSLMICISLSSC